MGTWACQSLHDVIRFAHEMAIQSMFEIGDRLLDSPIGGVKQLDCPSLISMYLVDLGGGLHAEAVSRRSVKPEDIASVPLQGLWRGLERPGVRPGTGYHVSIVRIRRRQRPDNSGTARDGGAQLCVHHRQLPQP